MTPEKQEKLIFVFCQVSEIFPCDYCDSVFDSLPAITRHFELAHIIQVNNYCIDF